MALTINDVSLTLLRRCNCRRRTAGIDHRLSYDDSGIWKRSNQLALLDIMIVGELAGGIWEGGETRLGRTVWQSIDSSVLAGISAQALKYTFTRTRPGEINDPNLWFQGSPHYSFPSGEVAAVSAIVTPFVLEYRQDNPSICFGITSGL